ncbi:MAG: hypothetical protein JJE52_10520, partial [Acidimicrobiia bacterium]|nr:hypothetical protein [Acidimicrobiia bacterium]
MADEVLDRPEVDELYAAEPSDFVTARAAAVKALKAAGDKDAAAVVAKLKKPTRVAWAINQVARRAGDRIGELRAAGADLRERQAEALAG